MPLTRPVLHSGLGVVSRSQAASGALAGKDVPEAAPAADIRTGDGEQRIQDFEWRADSIDIAAIFSRHAAERANPAVTVAVSCVRNNSLVTSANAGLRIEGLWDGDVAALGYGFTVADEAPVVSFVPDGLASIWFPAHPRLPLRAGVLFTGGNEAAARMQKRAKAGAAARTA